MPQIWDSHVGFVFPAIGSRYPCVSLIYFCCSQCYCYRCSIFPVCQFTLTPHYIIYFYFTFNRACTTLSLESTKCTWRWRFQSSTFEYAFAWRHFLSDFSTGTNPRRVTTVCLNHTASATINSNNRLLFSFNTKYYLCLTTLLCWDHTTPFC